MTSITAFAPATVANVGVGFDILGFATEGVGDRVTVTRLSEPGRVEIGSISGLPDLPKNPAENTAGRALLKMAESLRLPFGFRVDIEKGIAMGSGMGGSSASAVGAVVAANELLAQPLPKSELLSFAIDGECAASGARHADNVAPCLFGGLQLIRSMDPLDVVSLRYPKELLCVITRPDFPLETRKARGVLARELSLETHVAQSANLASLVAACAIDDWELIRRSLKDVLIEPQRAKLIPGFREVQRAALQAGALGCTISGAGPSLFAWSRSVQQAEEIRSAMVHAFGKAGIQRADSWISPISAKGAFAR